MGPESFSNLPPKRTIEDTSTPEQNNTPGIGRVADAQEVFGDALNYAAHAKENHELETIKDTFHIDLDPYEHKAILKLLRKLHINDSNIDNHMELTYAEKEALFKQFDKKIQEPSCISAHTAVRVAAFLYKHKDEFSAYYINTWFVWLQALYDDILWALDAIDESSMKEESREIVHEETEYSLETNQSTHEATQQIPRKSKTLTAVLKYYDEDSQWKETSDLLYIDALQSINQQKAYICKYPRTLQNHPQLEEIKQKMKDVDLNPVELVLADGRIELFGLTISSVLKRWKAHKQR